MRLRRLALPLLLLLTTALAALHRTPVTVYLAGDSTMAPKLATRRPETGWGEMLQQYFDPAAVRIDNRAKNGRSTRTFLAEGLWQSIADSLRPGDLVFIQFGHNDESQEKADRYTPAADYRRNLERFVAEARSRGATPVLLTPVARRRFDAAGRVVHSHGEYPELVRTVARELGAPLIDMERASEGALAEYGVQGSRTLFLQLRPGEHPNYPTGIEDNTHFSPVGAAVMAGLAVEGIRQAVPALAAHLAPAPALRRVAVLR